jgi:hypothetical protein
MIGSGTCGRGARWYGNERAVLYGRLTTDKRKPYRVRRAKKKVAK